MPKILIVEDEPAMLMGLRDNFEFEDYQVETATNGQEGLEKAQNETFDLIVSDVMMPKLSGFDLCRKLRESGNKTPIILLTAKGQEIDRVLGLEIGADDYVTKPFSLRELLARVKAVLRRTQNVGNSANEVSAEQQKIQIGRLAIDFEAYQAWENEEEIPLTHREFDVLHYLFLRSHKTVSRDELLQKVWGFEQAPTSRTVDNFILKLRQKLEFDSAKPRFLHTVHGIGYKFIP